MQSDRDGKTVGESATWIPKTPTTAENPHMSDDFARVYDETATRITGPIALAALDLVADIGRGVRVLDIASGPGTLSIPAAERGASVLAVDIAPGMVNRLSARLGRHPGLDARIMDGQALALEDASFDAAFSIIGVSLFPDWRKGLREQARILRPGGRGCIATWRKLPGGGPFLVMAQALRTIFPDRPPPAPPEGFVVLSAPAQLEREFRAAGFDDIAIREVEALWEGPGGKAYLEDLRELHPYMGPYRLLSADERAKVDREILSIVDTATTNGRVSLSSSVLLAVGTRK